jgi:hypothetical protein
MQEISVIHGIVSGGSPSREVFGRKIGFLGRLFGCYHKNLSRPFNSGEVSYRSCLECGARKRFDPQSLKTFRPFYYPPAIDH